MKTFGPIAKSFEADGSNGEQPFEYPFDEDGHVAGPVDASPGIRQTIKVVIGPGCHNAIGVHRCDDLKIELRLIVRMRFCERN